MWIRLRIDIRWVDLMFGMASLCSARDRSTLHNRATNIWSDDGDAFVCLSVRSGFDLLLQSLQLPQGSEVLLSALTVPDMKRIVEHHNLVAVPVDLVEKGFSPCLRSLRERITPATRVLVVAHLFGFRVPMEPILQIAKEHNLLVVEDCAQDYRGTQYLGHPETDVAMFSFGPIKTATALGGALFRVRDADLRERMWQTQSDYPVQSRRAHLARLLKYSVLKALSARVPFGVAARCFGAAGYDPDVLIGRLARNFPSKDFIHRIRRQPSTPLLKLLLRRWHHYDPDRLRTRTEKGYSLAKQLGEVSAEDDQASDANTSWVFPVLVSDPDSAVKRLRQVGFDATNQSRLEVVSAPEGRTELEPHNAKEAVLKTVFLPWYPELIDDAARVIPTVLNGEVELPVEWTNGHQSDQ